MLFSSAAMADIALPPPRLSPDTCEECFSCYQCDSKSWKEHALGKNCSKCIILQCNYIKECAQIAPFPSSDCHTCFQDFDCKTMQYSTDYMLRGEFGLVDSCIHYAPASECHYEEICANKFKAPKDNTAQQPKPKLEDIESQTDTKDNLKPVQEATNPVPEATNPENTKKSSSCSALYQNEEDKFSLAMILAAILALFSLLSIALLRAKDSKP